MNGVRLSDDGVANLLVHNDGINKEKMKKLRKWRRKNSKMQQQLRTSQDTSAENFDAYDGIG